MSTDGNLHRGGDREDNQVTAHPVLLAKTLVSDALEFLQKQFAEHTFYVERDVVWTVQAFLRDRIRSQGAADLLTVHNDYPIFPGARRSKSADICLVSPTGIVCAAVEFKFEPCHKRTDILTQKLPVVFWGKQGVTDDILKVKRMVDEKRALFALSIFIDEGRCFRHRIAPEYSEWHDWAGNTSALIAKFEASTEGPSSC